MDMAAVVQDTWGQVLVALAHSTGVRVMAAGAIVEDMGLVMAVGVLHEEHLQPLINGLGY